MNHPELIVMLTKNDYTVFNAPDIFEALKNSPVRFWGIKEKGLEHAQMKSLCTRFKECGKTAVLEVVAYKEEECLSGARLAIECGFDILLGTCFFDSVNTLCRENGIKYMPFAGDVSNRPSVLNGDIDAMIATAQGYAAKGVYGIDLLGYRYTGDSEHLIREFISKVDLPVCVAGSINSFSRLESIKKYRPAFFTIGGAFFENKFGSDLSEQLIRVTDYIANE